MDQTEITSNKLRNAIDMPNDGRMDIGSLTLKNWQVWRNIDNVEVITGTVDGDQYLMFELADVNPKFGVATFRDGGFLPLGSRSTRTDPPFTQLSNRYSIIFDYPESIQLQKHIRTDFAWRFASSRDQIDLFLLSLPEFRGSDLHDYDYRHITHMTELHGPQGKGFLVMDVDGEISLLRADLATSIPIDDVFLPVDDLRQAAEILMDYTNLQHDSRIQLWDSRIIKVTSKACGYSFLRLSGRHDGGGWRLSSPVQLISWKKPMCAITRSGNQYELLSVGDPGDAMNNKYLRSFVAEFGEKALIEDVTEAVEALRSSDFLFNGLHEISKSDMDALTGSLCENDLLAPTLVSEMQRSKVRRHQQTRLIPVFSADVIDDLAMRIPSMMRDQRERYLSDLKMMRNMDGMREVPSFGKSVEKSLLSMTERFRNFEYVIDELHDDLILAGKAKATHFRVAPMLLSGEPGVGKTAFCNSLATALGVKFKKLTAGGMQGAFALTGSAAHWANAQSGQVFQLLASSDTSTAILLIDEVDKLNTDYSNILPALLELLEPESARQYRDEALAIEFDASKLVIVMTCNDTNLVDSALLSRCRHHHVLMPDHDQRLAIGMAEHDAIRASLTGKDRLPLDAASMDALANSDVDIRAILMAVRKGYAKALRAGNQVNVPVCEIKNKSVSIGFHSA